jgi:hypothetical protein
MMVVVLLIFYKGLRSRLDLVDKIKCILDFHPETLDPKVKVRLVP